MRRALGRPPGSGTLAVGEEAAMSEAVDKPDEVTAAIQAAKEFLLKTFQGEKIENLGLEEVRQNKHDDTWEVTLGFSRR